jgi:hypothetical protein
MDADAKYVVNMGIWIDGLFTELLYILRYYIKHLSIYFNLTYSFLCSFRGNRFCNIMLQHPQYNTIDNTIDQYETSTFIQIHTID